MTSEMSGEELASRIENFKGIRPETWRKIEFVERSYDFQDLVLSDGITIIDYFEISDSFYQIARNFGEIHKKLKTGLCVVALQMDQEKDTGRGGSFGLEKPRLYITMKSDPPNGNLATIKKCKNWAVKGDNPNRKTTYFKVVDGAKIIMMRGWQRPAAE